MIFIYIIYNWTNTLSFVVIIPKFQTVELSGLRQVSVDPGNELKPFLNLMRYSVLIPLSISKDISSFYLVNKAHVLLVLFPLIPYELV